MSAEPLFSVVIPCFNSEEYLEECLDSVVSQTFGDWEIVAVDDGSTDGTAAILADALASLEGRMRVVSQGNSGLLLARRAGLRAARGKYVAFLDSDDAFRRDALETVASATGGRRPPLVQFCLTRREGFEPEGPSTLGRAGLSGRREASPSDFRMAVCQGTALNNLCGKVIRRDVCGIERDYSVYRGVKNGEDLLQLVEVLARLDGPVSLIDEPLYFYRQNPRSITHTWQRGFYASVRAANLELRMAASKWGRSFVDECDRRLLRSVYASVTNAATGGLLLGELISTIREMGEDGFFRDAYRLVGTAGFPRKQRVVLGALWARAYVSLALSLRAAGGVRGR